MPVPATDCADRVVPVFTVMPTCLTHLGSIVRMFRTNGPNGAGAYPQCVPAHGQPHLLAWADALLVPELVATHLTAITPSEYLVLMDAANGMSVAASAASQFKGQETVKSQRRSIMMKFGANNMTHAVGMAVKDGLIDSESPQLDLI